MRTTSRLRNVHGALGALAAVAVIGLLFAPIASIENGLAASRATSRAAAWSNLAIDAAYSPYGSFEEMADASTAVVRGTIVSVAPGRTLVNDPKYGARDTVYYLAAKLVVADVLHGQLAQPGPSVTLELFAPNSDAAAAILKNPPLGEGVFFLINKAEHPATAYLPPELRKLEAAYYEAAWPQGVILNQDGTADAVGDIEDDDFLNAWAGRPFGDVLSRVKAIK